jgi:hypothetical protein
VCHGAGGELKKRAVRKKEGKKGKKERQKKRQHKVGLQKGTLYSKKTSARQLRSPPVEAGVASDVKVLELYL